MKAKLRERKREVKPNEASAEKEGKAGTKRDAGGTVCQICNKKVRSRYHLNIHMAVHTGEKNYICGICKNGYQQKWNLITHVARVHSKEKPFKCNECERAFGYSSHFKRHVKTHFLDKIDASDAVKKIILNPHKCHFCEKSFESNYRLELHLRTHTGTRPYVCDKCGKSFTTKRLCRMHIRKNHEEAFVCEHCGETFPESSALLCHLSTGHGMKGASEGASVGGVGKEAEAEDLKRQLAPCEVCGKSIMRGSMKKHLNIHYRRRVYGCRYCEKEFLESGQRMVHERKHTGEKPYVCDVCERGHTQYGNLLIHRKRCHNLSGKTPRLWKRNQNQNGSKVERAEVSTAGCGAGWRPQQEPEASALQYTGDETLQEFLKKASTWVNEKFEEHKQQKQLTSRNPEKEETEAEGIVASPEESSGLNDSSLGEGGGGREGREEREAKTLKETKSKINRVIFDKIVEDLSSRPEREKVLRVVESVRMSGDVLREFFKKMKTVPDNVVMRTTNGTLYWHCWLCESKLKSRHLLSRHLIIHEPEENRPYRCDECYKTFTQSNNFKEHKLSHVNENQYYCEICGGGFRHKTHFNNHMKRHNPQTTGPLPKKHECSYCDKKMYTKYQKAEHERTHTRERPFLCKICGQQFTTSSTLRRHHFIHCNATHQCDICFKLFKQKSSLKRHYNVHSTDSYDRVSCECGKTLSQSSSLKKHKMVCKVREGPVVRPFACSLCPKNFLTKSDLKRHAGTHDSTKKFTCPLCFTSLKTHETLRRHMRRHDDARSGTPTPDLPLLNTNR